MTRRPTPAHNSRSAGPRPRRTPATLRAPLSRLLSRLGDFFAGAPAAPARRASAPRVEPPPQPKAEPVKPVDPRKEFAAGLAFSGGGWITPGAAEYFATLPKFRSRIAGRFGDSVYDEMLLDPQVSSNLETLVDAALADGLHVRPAVEDKDDPDYDAAKELAEFGEYCLEYPARPVDVCLEEQLAVACSHGGQLSEVVTEAGSGRWGGWDVLCRYKPLPRESYRLVVNGFGSLVGAHVLRPGEAALPAPGAAPAADAGDVLPLEKFAPLAWQARGGDPRGTSLIDRVYEAWWHKRQTIAESIKFIARFGTPWLFLTAPEGAQAVPPQDAYGNATGEAVDPVKALRAEGEKMQNGGVLAAAHGTLMQLLTSTSKGEAFFRKIEACDLQITIGILGATRMTQEAKSGSKADSQTAQDVVGLRVKRAKRLLSVMLTELLYNLVKWNKGKAVADRLAPRVTLNPTEQQDWSERAAAAAAIGFTLDPSQFPGVDEELNLPPRAAPAAPDPGALGAPPDATVGTPAPAPGLPQPTEAASP